MEEIRSKKEIAAKIVEIGKGMYVGNTKELNRANIDILKLVLRIGNRKDIITKMLELQKELEYKYTDNTKELIRAKIGTLKWVLCRT